MLPPADSPYEVDSRIEIPYGNVKSALDSGFKLDNFSGDNERYAHDLFTELHGKGQAPSVESKDQDNIDQYGVVPVPAAGTKDWYKRGGIKTAHATINSLPAITAGIADIAVGIPGAATGPGDLALVAATNAGAATAGEVAKQTLNHYLFGETMTPEDRVKSVGKEALIGGIMGPTGRVAAKPLGRLARYFGETAEAADKAGFRMLPSEAHAAKAGVFETYPKGSIFTSGKMANWRELQNKETEAAARKLANDISAKSLSATGSREEAGEAIREGIESHMRDFSKNQEVVYSKIEKDAKAAGAYASRKDLVASAQKELDRINKVRNEVGGQGPTDEFKKELQSIIDNKRPYASYKAMKDYRSALLARLRSQNSLMSSDEKHILSSIAGEADKAIEDGLKASKNPNLANVWRAANTVTKEEHEAFAENLVKNMAAKKHPEDIALLLRGNSPSAIAPLGIDETRQAMQIIPKNLVPQVQKQILLDTIYEATEKGTTGFNEGMFSKKILQIGDERGEVLFGQQWPKIKEFSQLLNKIKESGGLSGASLSNPEVVKRVTTQVSRMIGELTVLGGGSALRGGSPVVDAAIGLGPIVGEAALWKTVAAALTHPEMSEKLLIAMRRAARFAPYGADIGYNLSKKAQEFVNKSKDDLIKKSEPLDRAGRPQSSLAKPLSPQELRERANQMNPAATGQVAYDYHAVHPETGHHVISRDGRVWIDPNTGQQVG
ncbi:unnamed protein product [Sphagnum jensenii]